jgi:UDP-glucose 4-epimerase
MNLLITGGAGFIGSHLADEAVRAGWKVAVLDNLSSGTRRHLPTEVTLFEVDVRDAQAVDAVFATFRPDVVSHQAAQASVSVSVREPITDAMVNVIGGLHVLDAARRYETRRVVFASTGGAIYGEVPEGTLADERSAPRPYSPYATSKLSFETYLETYRQQYGLEYTSLRYANVYGPRQNPHGEAGVVAIFAANLLRGHALYVNARTRVGDEGCLRDYVYVADVVRANMLAATDEFSERVVNVGTGVAVTTLELARTLMESLGREVNIEFTPPRPGDLGRSCLDPQLLQRSLTSLTSLRDGLDVTTRWFAAHLQPS